MSTIEPEPVSTMINRNPSLEAQREPTPTEQRRTQLWLTWLSSIGIWAQPREDRVEEILSHKSESKSGNARIRRRLKSLRQEYSHFKGHGAVASYRRNAFTSFLSGQPSLTRFSCDNLLSYWTFRYPGDGGDLARLRVHENEKTSDWMHRILVQLEENTPDTLQLVAFAEQPGRQDLEGVFSSLRYTVATMSGRLGTLHLFPTWIMEVLLAHTWGIELMPWSRSYGPQNVYEFARPKPLALPSLRASSRCNSVTSFESAEKRYWGQDRHRPGNLDPTRGKNEMLLFWQSDLVPFTSDFAVYIWEYQKEIPAAEYAKVILCPPGFETESTRLVITFQTCRAHTLFSEKRDSRFRTPRTTASLANDNGPRWSPLSDVVVSIYCVFEVMIADTSKFMSDCHEQASRMHLIGRKNPSTSKVRFLMHLEDRRKAAKAGVTHALDVLSVFVAWAQQETNDSGEQLSALKEDLEFLDQELGKLQTDIEKDQDVLRQHFQLEQDLRLFRLTLLAAIFLPLSFTTSLFGMNIAAVDDSTVDESGTYFFSKWTNTTIASLVPDAQGPTKALVSMIQQSSNTSYPWQTVLITAIALLSTLPLTLFFGAIIRSLTVSASKYVVYWRAVAVIAGTAYIIFSIIASSTTLLIPFDEAGGWDLIDYNSTITFIFQRFIIINTVINSPFFLYVLWMVYRSWRSSRHLLLWASILGVTVVFSVLTFTLGFRGDKNIPPLMLFPWLYLGLALWYMRWRKRAVDLTDVVASNMSGDEHSRR
ncbi:hypothetical protein F4808DRAFT_91071 [Astrocystis sublimbata]|nr:hypothetical protein F4808DRAFT_91071 [Astrocystis sublimbata]